VLAITCSLLSGVAVAKEKIRFGYVNWPGVTVKTHVANEILQYLGYETDMKMLSVPVVFKGLVTKDLDLFMGAWLPTMMSIVEKYFNNGTIVSVAVNLDETIYTLAVPKYAWDAGVKSHADLNKFADRFDSKIIGIEPGNDGNKLVLDMIKNNTYHLRKWELVEGSAEAMMIAVGSAFKQKQWVVWLGWSPHWMNMAYGIKYLKDPEHVWGSEPEIVRTVARAGLDKDNPNVYRLFSQFHVTPEIQNNWINQYSREKRKPEQVAKEWIRNNLGIVDQWVYGVTSVDGERARDAIRKALK
jgi:glycine betaine/proline transport system substrate-binding protein